MNPCRWRILSGVAWLVAAGCAAGAVLTRHYPPIILREDVRAGFTLGVRLDHGSAYFSWRPGAEYRPAWAGQVNRFGFRYTRWSNGSGEVGVPLWAPALAAATAATAAGAVSRSRRRASRGRCRRCGYDLRATPDRCPECGTIPAGKPAS